jgi:hypothetical protein
VGAIIAYSDTMEKETVDVTSSSNVLSTEVGLKAEAKLIFGGPGFTIAAELGYVGERETSESTEKSQVKARSRSFALGDADDGDFFDVQVCQSIILIFAFLLWGDRSFRQIFLDPVYGSFLFSTMSGQSRYALK